MNSAEDELELSFRAVSTVHVRVEHLSIDIDTSPALQRYNVVMKRKHGRLKAMLKDISADMPSGQVSAILGASGSGKTTLLNALSHRIEGGRLQTRGTVMYNGSPKLSTIRSAYVMQQDVHLETLTVRETLQYAAELRLPPPTTAKERSRVVEEVILELGLVDCANTRIGNNIHKGCSGGEKRRTSLAVQMLSNPSVLFLDEPTTGLDAFTAFQLVKTLKALARRGRTIVMTIHQPRSEIWTLFDSITLLADGSALYSGPTSACLPYFERLNLSLPAYMNPAEFLIDQAAIDTRSPEAEAASTRKVNGLVQAWRDHAQDFQAQGELKYDAITTSSSRAHHASFWRQTRVLAQRSFKTTWRDPYGLVGSLIEALSMSIITGWIFYKLDGSQQGIRSREGALYIGVTLQTYLVTLYEVYRLTFDIPTFDRERGERVVSVPAWLLSRRLARFPLEDLPVPLIFSIITYFMIGYRSLASQFFIYFGILFLMHHIAVNVAVVCVALSRDFATASLISNMIFTLQSLASGYFVQADEIPPWVRWLKWTAYTFYGYSAAAVNEFILHTSNPRGQFYDCPYPGGEANPACQQYTGSYIMSILQIPFDDLNRPVILLLGYALGFFAISALVLVVLKVRMGVAQAKDDDTAYAADDQLDFRVSREARSIRIALHGYSLDITKQSLPFRKATKLSILKPLDVEFLPGGLNVVMGPSGSGKTSLLNSMARRLHSTLTTRFLSRGEMTFNGAVPSSKVVRSICSFVSQDDDQLLPYLTVRENLHFAAYLRLPSHFSSQQKQGRAEDVLKKLGLRGCANNLVGGGMIKGISGGEKRRTTIAIQILADPKILFLDEPTSGLDAFTATSIVDVLRGLASEGRTLVLTVHQSRSDLFPLFDNILLLARGGSLVYSGAGNQMVSYLTSQGHKCPIHTNPADFALDTITVDLQNQAKGDVTRANINALVSNWQRRPVLDRVASHIATPAELGSLARDMTPLRIALPVLMHRSFINFRRNRVAIIARTTQVIAFGAILALFFSPLKNDLPSVLSRLGFVQEVLPLYFIGMLQCVAVYPQERDVFYREHDDNTYSIEAFFLQYTLAEVPFEIFTSLIMGVFVDIAAGLARTQALFFIVTFNSFAIVSTGESLGIIFNTLFLHTGFAVNVTSVFLSLATVMAGIMSVNLPSFLQAFNHLSPLKWSVGNLVPYTLRGVEFTCTPEQRVPPVTGTCPITTGEQVLVQYNLDSNPRLNLLALGVCVVVYRFVAYAVLKAKKNKWDWREKQWPWPRPRKSSAEEQAKVSVSSTGS